MSQIVVIDDDELLRLTVRQMLEASGHEVRDAENGAIGVKMCEEHVPDLIITDIIMPDVEGIETIGSLREIAPACKIIAMSGGGRIGSLDYLSLAEKMGANGTLRKPFGKAELLETINKVLGSD